MQMTKETEARLNDLLGLTFACNAESDNIAYNIDYAHYPKVGSIYHESWAHHFPAIADEILDMMIQLDSRPVRKALPEFVQDFQGDIVAMFGANLAMAEKYRQEIIKTIEIAEYNGDYEVKLFLEDYLVGFMPYRKQAEVWAVEAQRYKGNEKSFDARFDKFTTFIDIEGDDDEDEDDDD